MTGTLTPTATDTRAALVFGGSRGIGAATVRRLAADGFAVAFTYASSAEQADALVREIEGKGGRALAVRADSTEPDAITHAVEEVVGVLGQLTAVVVNAGIARVGLIQDVPLADLDEMLAVNVRGVYLAVQATVPHLVDGARVVTIGSNVAVRTGTAGASVYQLTKTAVAGLVKGVALDLAPRGITVNNLQPGPVDTDINTGAVDQLIARSPMNKIASPDDIADFVSYLTGDSAHYVTGASLTVDGGFTL